MVPTPLIMLFLMIAFFPSAFAYMIAWPERRLANRYFALLAGIGGTMFFALTLQLLGLSCIWLSWVLLAIAVVLISCSIKLARKGRATLRAREREIANARARGR